MVRALERLRLLLEAHTAGSGDIPGPLELDPGSSLARVCTMFGLSEFERDVLTLAAAPELDGSFPELCARAAGEPSRSYPTLSLALAALPNPAWSALLPQAPLRLWRLIETDGPSLVGGLLRADEAVTHVLLGFAYHDARLRSILSAPGARAGTLAPQQQSTARAIADVWRRDPNGRAQVVCTDRSLARAIAGSVAEMLGAVSTPMRFASLPAHSAELIDTLRLCERVLVFNGGFGVLECDAIDDPQRERAIDIIAQRFRLPLLIVTEAQIDLAHAGVVAFEIERPTRDEQATYWQSRLTKNPNAMPMSRRLAAQFDLHLDTIDVVTAAAPADADVDSVWELVRTQARPQLDALAERIETTAAWRDLVLPADRRRLLRQVVDHVRYRDVVYREWGFSRESGARGLTVLFAGASGTGKSLAARVLANILRLDLYRVDLSAVFSKYIGETEKNLRRIFDAAESGGVVLVFDEADALFGKRSEVNDSHDRHANVEVSYLLQRLERFNGVAILTSNLREAFDAAFMRRFRFVVDFPFPDATLRKRIWKRAFPGSVPTDELNFELLARLAVPGGNISNIALNAAVRAAARSRNVGMTDVAGAVRLEYAKLDRSLHDPDLARWLESVPVETLARAAV